VSVRVEHVAVAVHVHDHVYDDVTAAASLAKAAK